MTCSDGTRSARRLHALWRAETLARESHLPKRLSHRDGLLLVNILVRAAINRDSHDLNKGDLVADIAEDFKICTRTVDTRISDLIALGHLATIDGEEDGREAILIATDAGMAALEEYEAALVETFKAVLREAALSRRGNEAGERPGA